MFHSENQMNMYKDQNQRCIQNKVDAMERFDDKLS